MGHYAIFKTHFRFKDIYRLNMKGWKKILHANDNQRDAKGNGNASGSQEWLK